MPALLQGGRAPGGQPGWELGTQALQDQVGGSGAHVTESVWLRSFHTPLLVDLRGINACENRVAVLKMLNAVFCVTQQLRSRYSAKEANAYVHTEDCP